MNQIIVPYTCVNEFNYFKLRVKRTWVKLIVNIIIVLYRNDNDEMGTYNHIVESKNIESHLTI